MCATLQVIPAEQSRLLKQSVRHVCRPSFQTCTPVTVAGAWLHMPQTNVMIYLHAAMAFKIC